MSRARRHDEREASSRAVAYMVTMDPFAPWLERWRLTPDGAAFATHSSRLLPVIYAGAPAMLKLAIGEEERRGGALMAWYGGEGAARVLDHDGEAILLERAAGPRSLVQMARDGQDDEATRILCDAAARLHAPRPTPAPATLVPLATWFAALKPAAARHGGVLVKSHAAACALLAGPQDIVPLHGDIHHGNVLDGGARGWLAIDPKGLIGERGFDHANLLCNPDGETAAAPGRLARQADIMARAAGLERTRLLTWVLAYAGLSASWTLSWSWHGDPQPALDIAAIAAAALGL